MITDMNCISFTGRLQDLRLKLDELQQEILNEARGQARKHVLEAYGKSADIYCAEIQSLQTGIRS